MSLFISQMTYAMADLKKNQWQWNNDKNNGDTALILSIDEILHTPVYSRHLLLLKSFLKPPKGDCTYMVISNIPVKKDHQSGPSVNEQ